MAPQPRRHAYKIRLDAATLRRLRHAAAARKTSVSRLASDAVAARLPRWSRKTVQPVPCL
jgi:predicted transcriptional regulator